MQAQTSAARFGGVRTSVTLLAIVLVTCVLLATAIVVSGHAARVFNQQLGTVARLNWAFLVLCSVMLAVLLASLFSGKFPVLRIVVLVIVAGTIAEELALTAYDRHFISSPHSNREDAAYSIFTHGGTFYLGQPNATSPLGFRTMRVEPKVAAGRRILLLGDSFVVGTGDTAVTNYAQVLETNLQKSFPEEKITVFPAGENGAGIEEQRYMFDYLIDQGYRFDAVVMHFYLGGDQVNNVRGTNRISIDGRPARIHTNPLLRYFYPLNFTAFRFLVNQNATAHASEWHPGAALTHETATCPISPSFQEYSMEAAKASYAPGADKRVDLPYSEDLLKSLTDEVRSKGIPFVLVLLPDYNAAVEAQRAVAARESMDYDWIRNGLKAQVAGAYPVLDLTESFMNRADLFQCNGIHWSDSGNVHAADLVAPFVAQHLLEGRKVNTAGK